MVVAAEAAKAAAAKGATHGGSTFGEGLTRSGNEISCDIADKLTDGIWGRKRMYWNVCKIDLRGKLKWTNNN